MCKLEPADVHCLSAVMGWLELGNVTEAEAELARLRPAVADHPDSLEIRFALLSAQARWEPALEVARKITRMVPERVSGWLHLAYALRRVPSGGLRAAWEVLLPMQKLFPREPTVAYNLACYACQMHQPDEAWEWLLRAMKLADQATIKKMALTDADLEPLWERINESPT